MIDEEKQNRFRGKKERSADTQKKISETRELSQNMNSEHSNINIKIAAFRARRNEESLQRNDILTGMRENHTRLQKKIKELEDMTGQEVIIHPLNFMNKHFHCEDVAASLQKIQENPTQKGNADEQKIGISAKKSIMQRFVSFFLSEHIF